MDASSLRKSKRTAQELEVKQLRAQELEARVVNDVQELEGDGSLLHELEANVVKQSGTWRRSRM